MIRRSDYDTRTANGREVFMKCIAVALFEESRREIERGGEWKSLIILFIVVAVAGMLLSLEHVALLFVCLLFFIDVLRCTSARLYSFHCLHSVFRMLVQIVCCRCVLYVLYLSESFVDTLVFYSIPFLFVFFLLLFLSDPLRPKSNSHWNVRRVHKFEQKDRWQNARHSISPCTMNKAHRSIYIYTGTRDRHWTPTIFGLSWYFIQIQLNVGPYPSKCLPNVETMLTKNFGFEYTIFSKKQR